MRNKTIATSPYPKWAYKKAGERLFRRESMIGQGNGFKLKENRLRLDITMKFFTVRVMRHWNSLPKKVVHAPSLEVTDYFLDVFN